jgi:hypothetical protein
MLQGIHKIGQEGLWNSRWKTMEYLGLTGDIENEWKIHMGDIIYRIIMRESGVHPF